MAVKTNYFALYVIMFNIFIAFSGIGLIIPIMPQYLASFGVAGQALGFLIATMSFSQFIFSPVAGNLSDRYGRKPLIIFGLVVFGLSQLSFGLANHLWLLYVSRFFTGVGSAFLVPPLMALVADITTYKDRGKGMGYVGASISFGFMIGPAIGGFLSNVSLNFPFFVSAVAAVIAAIISIFALPNPKPNDISIEETTVVKSSENSLQQMKRSIYTPYFIILIVIFILSFGLANFQSTLTLFSDIKFGLTPSDISIVITVGGLMGVIIQTLLINKLFIRFGEMNVILFNLIVAAIAMISMLFVNGFWTILLVNLIFSVGTTLIRPATNTLVSKLAKNEQGYAAGMNNAYMSLGNMVGPALAGSLFDFKMILPYIVGTIILLSAFTLSLIWSKKKKELLQSL